MTEHQTENNSQNNKDWYLFYGDGQNHAADDDMYESQDISDDELAQLQSTADDTSKMPAERDAARNKIYASRAKKEQQEVNEFMIRRWQHYAGIK